jgi:hypothetical protein
MKAQNGMTGEQVKRAETIAEERTRRCIAFDRMEKVGRRYFRLTMNRFSRLSIQIFMLYLQ